MSIQEIYQNFKRFLGEGDTRLAGLMVLVGVSSFALGRMSESAPIGPILSDTAPGMVIEARSASSQNGPHERTSVPQTDLARVAVEGGYVASKNGTKYHLPWCGSAKQIKEENKIWFATKAEAEAAGYTPASNCKGI